MENLAKTVGRTRKNFSRIQSTLAIPNLIDVQKRSYDRFLQMNLLPEERANQGLQSVFTSIFPFSDFRETCSLDFVKYTIGEWQCKCGEMKGLEFLRTTCTNCGSRVMTDHPHEETVTCTQCGFVNKNRVTKCDTCGNPVDLHLDYSIADCQERGMTFAVPLKVTFRLFVYDKDPETGRAHDARRQGGRGLLRRDPADERSRYLHRERHRARDREPAAPLPRSVLHQGRPAHLSLEDHPLSWIVGGVRVRPEGSALGPHRPQAQVPRHRVPARPGPRDRRVDPAPVLRGGGRRRLEPLGVHADDPADGAGAGAAS